MKLRGKDKGKPLEAKASGAWKVFDLNPSLNCPFPTRWQEEVGRFWAKSDIIAMSSCLQTIMKRTRCGHARLLLLVIWLCSPFNIYQGLYANSSSRWNFPRLKAENFYFLQTVNDFYLENDLLFISTFTHTIISNPVLLILQIIAKFPLCREHERDLEPRKFVHV